METTLFDFAAERLEHHTGFSRIESRGTLRLALKSAGLEPKSLSLDELCVVFEKLMPGELETRGVSDADAHSRAEEGLARVGMAGRMAHRPAQLSGGEQQRCAVARALINDPKVLLADEPSGNLDERHAGLLHDLLFELARDMETALVIVTHNRALSERADRTLVLARGQLQPESPRPASL